MDIIERLRFDAARCEATYSKGVATNIEEAADAIERLTAENERLRSQLGHCPNTTDGHHDWMMYLVGPDGQRLGPGSSPAGHGAAAVFCQYCGAPKLPVEENRVVLSDQQRREGT